MLSDTASVRSKCDEDTHACAIRSSLMPLGLSTDTRLSRLGGTWNSQPGMLSHPEGNFGFIRGGCLLPRVGGLS